MALGMDMRKHALLGAMALVCWGSLAAQNPQQEPVRSGITKGRLIKGSTSPDGKYALFEYHLIPEDTKTGVGIKPVDRSKLLCDVDSRTKWMTDREVHTFLDFLWNADSSVLATHDSLLRHSRLSLYQLSEGTAKVLDVPDLLGEACKRLGISKAKVSSSGQVPVKWTAAKSLEIKVRLKLKGGRMASTTLRIAIANGKVALAD